jgi:hypothetical protein
VSKLSSRKDHERKELKERRKEGHSGQQPMGSHDVHMRAAVRPLVIYVLAGAAATFAMAWVCAWLRPLPTAWPGLIGADRHGECWMGFGEHGLGWTHLTLYGASGSIDPAAAAKWPRWIHMPRAGDLESRCISVIGAGWPMTALRAETVGVGHVDPPPGRGWHSGLGPQWVEWGRWRGAFVLGAGGLPTNPSTQRVLPIGIVWPGFAINVLFWTAVCTLPVVLLATRRALRVRRGRCPACGYDLRGDSAAGCSECGWRRAPSPQAGSTGVPSRR